MVKKYLLVIYFFLFISIFLVFTNDVVDLHHITLKKTDIIDNLKNNLPIRKYNDENKYYISTRFNEIFYQNDLDIFIHNGIDFYTDKTIPVYPTSRGVIDKIGFDESIGVYVVVKHSDNISTIYGHLLYIQKNINVGDNVDINNQIGQTGGTGACTGMFYLFYGIQVKNNLINPLELISKDKFDIVEL